MHRGAGIGEDSRDLNAGNKDALVYWERGGGIGEKGKGIEKYWEW